MKIKTVINKNTNDKNITRRVHRVKQITKIELDKKGGIITEQKK